MGRGRKVIGISGSLILSKTLMKLIFNSCGEFRWSQEDPVSQIHSPHLQVGAPGIFSGLLRSVLMLRREWGAESNGKPPHLFIPAFGRTAALVPALAVKDLAMPEHSDDDEPTVWGKWINLQWVYVCIDWFFYIFTCTIKTMTIRVVFSFGVCLSLSSSLKNYWLDFNQILEFVNYLTRVGYKLQGGREISAIFVKGTKKSLQLFPYFSI